MLAVLPDTEEFTGDSLGALYDLYGYPGKSYHVDPISHWELGFPPVTHTSSGGGILMKRSEREQELRDLLRHPSGRDELLQLLAKYMNLGPGETLPVGTPLIPTILRYEFEEPSEGRG